MADLAGRVRRRLGRELVRAGRRLTGPPAAPSAPAPGPAAAPGTIDLELYARDADPDRAAAIRSGAFGHGYLVRTGTEVVLPGFLGDWRRQQVGPLHLHLAPRTQVTVAGPADPGQADTVVVLGQPVDVDHGSTDVAAIAGRLRRTLARSGPDALVREAAYLAGRWTLLALGGDSRSPVLTVLPDAMASRPVFYRADVDGLTLASSEILVALAHDLPPSRAEAEAVAHGQLLRTGVVHSPGTLTAVEEVLPLVPNCLLRASLGPDGVPGRVRHERFWPFEQRAEETDLGEVAGAFADRMREHLRLLGELGPLWWSLTGGLDSRVTLAHSSPSVLTGTFTYLNPRDLQRSPEVADDLFVPNRLAAGLGVPHRVLRWRQAADGTVFDRLHRATYPLRRASHGAAHAMWADLPGDIVQVQSNGGEIGTTNTRARTDEPISPSALAALWLGPMARDVPGFAPIFADWAEHAQFRDDRLLGYDRHDLFYWEHRMGRWGHRKFLDGDLGHRLMLPFNDRRLLEIMHRSPIEQRVGKELYARVLDGRPDLDADR
ncbi:hypothetical protein [Serinicoccus kebangsaanensis]|uniref:hypothetical protein n=1 Tax=Serinicoccus kebangsaanensis TaxID=2602069 RepID=UPI00192DA846|nr:hypothetical protein [Serinicoccus kebangsaanensis]